MATDSSPALSSSRRDGPIALAIAAIVAATVAIGAMAPGAPPHKPMPERAVLPDSDPTCSEWSDGCRACARTPDGPVCSTPGIACTAGQQECLRRTTP